MPGLRETEVLLQRSQPLQPFPRRPRQYHHFSPQKSALSSTLWPLFDGFLETSTDVLVTGQLESSKGQLKTEANQFRAPST